MDVKHDCILQYTKLWYVHIQHIFLSVNKINNHCDDKLHTVTNTQVYTYTLTYIYYIHLQYNNCIIMIDNDNVDNDKYRDKNFKNW